MLDSEASPTDLSRFRLLFKAIQAYRQGHLGDVAAYKSAILGTKAYPQITAQLSTLEHCYPAIDLTQLGLLPTGSFGKSYAEHMAQYHLTPLRISPTVSDTLHHYSLALRYTLTHDIFHVLLGYDTSLIGELAVWTFVGAQHYSPSYETAAKLAARVYPCLQPHHYRQFKAIALESRARAQSALCLIAQPFEQYWSEPLDEVRHQFRLLMPTTSLSI